MKHPGLFIVAAMSICLSLFTLPLHGQDIIGHRGLFHNTTASMNVPENSLDSVVNAYNAGMFGVELDLRTSSDGIVMVTHDQISNRTTKDDNDGGYLNPVSVALNIQPGVSPIRISDYTAAFWETTSLKAYGTSSSLTTSSDAMLSLESFLQQAKAKGVFNRNFLIILDIQSPNIFSKAAQVVSSLGVQQNVYLKFFAKSALYNNQTYNGADTCNRYMLQNNLADSKLRLIAQINDGELDINEDDNAGITIWGTTMTIPEYLNCWRDASSQHNNLAYMAMVSASVPADNMNATQAAVAALNWARSNNRYTMSIVPNPDACKANGANNPTFQFQSNAVPAAVFNYQARNAKTQFVGSQNPNYIIYDVFGSGYNFTTNFNRYIAALCYGTPIN